MRMMLGYFLPDREFTWEELEKLSAKIEGKATWPQQMAINLHDMGFDVTMVEGFDGRAFIRDGADYLHRAFGKDIAEWQIANSDLPQEQKLYQAAYDRGVDIQKAIPTLADMQSYIKKGYLVAANVNSPRLRGKEGYVGHFVVILSIDDTELVLHDPGLPARPNVRVPIETFQAAWADPDDNAKNFIAIKPKEVTT